MKIVVISDVHGKWNRLQIPECDILVSCGDYSFKGEEHMVRDFHKWLDKQDANYLISIQGNHELWVEKNFNLAKSTALEVCPRVKFVATDSFELLGKKWYCSAVTPWFHNWAWNKFRGEEIANHWKYIPDDTEIMVTHGPVAGILDFIPSQNLGVGCLDLKDRIAQLPKLSHHFCGHIHEGYGHHTVNGVQYYNTSICDENYKPVNPITIVEI